MKTVFTNSMVAHVWAQLKQANGRNAESSMSFDGAVAYSYRQPVAHLLEVDGCQIALFTSEHFSVTTSAHVREYRGAVSGISILNIFYVPNIFSDARTRHYNYQHTENLKHLRDSYAKEVAMLMRSKVENYHFQMQYSARFPSPIHDYLSGFADRLSNYCRAFGLPAEVIDYAPDADAIIARRDRLMNDPKRVARAQAAGQKRQAAAAIENAKRLELWFAGEHVRVNCPEGGAMLRLSPGGYEVQTSWGARVPIADVKRALHLYDIVRGTVKKTWARGDSDVAGEQVFVTLGNFTLDRITSDGSIKAGCHTIYAAQIEALRAQL